MSSGQIQKVSLRGGTWVTWPHGLGCHAEQLGPWDLRLVPAPLHVSPVSISTILSNRFFLIHSTHSRSGGYIVRARRAPVGVKAESKHVGHLAGRRAEARCAEAGRSRAGPAGGGFSPQGLSAPFLLARRGRAWTVGSCGRDWPEPAHPLRCHSACFPVSNYCCSVSVAVTDARGRWKIRDAREVSPHRLKLRAVVLCFSALTGTNAE